MSQKKYLDYTGTSYLWGKITAKLQEKAAASDVSTLTTKVNTLIGSDTSKSVRAIAAEELAAKLIPKSAQESLDTLQEIAAWIQAHPAEASALNAKLELGTYVPEEGADPVQYPTVKAYVEAMIAAANAAMHSHSNKETLDGITSSNITAWNSAVTDQHTHSNKTVLDGISDNDITAWNGAVTAQHTHNNASAVNNLTQAVIDNSHTHANSSVLAGIEANDVAKWDYIGADDTTANTLRKRVADLEARDTYVAMSNAEIDAIINPSSGS